METITPEVHLDSKVNFLVRINGEELAFVDTKCEARLIVDSIAAAETQRLKRADIKVLREDLDEGNKVIVSTQKRGILMNGSVIKEITVDVIPVPRAFLVRSRHILE